MKRFWREARAELRDAAWHILLDGKPMRLPTGETLRLDRACLAAAIAAEWQAAGCEGGAMSMADVPLTRLAGTALFRIAPHPGPTVAALAHYATADCLCYRAEHPEALVVRQHHAWQPWLDWAAGHYQARLLATRGVMAVAQPPAAIAALHRAVAAQDSWHLAGLGILVPAFGSLVLGLAVAEGALGAADALELSLLDLLFQESQWGEDDEAAERRRCVAADVTQAALFMALSAA